MKLYRCQIVQSIFRKEGLRGFYSGLRANLIGVTPEKAIKLTVNDLSREWFAKQYQIDIMKNNLPTWMGLTSGAIAGTCQVLATNPMEIVKINMQMANRQSTRTWDVVKRLGLRGLYGGSCATLLRDIPFSMVLFQSFAVISQTVTNYFPNAGFGGVLIAGFTAGSIGAVFATPMDVAKTRFQVEYFASLQNGTKGRSLWQIYFDTRKHEGMSAFFKGCFQRCLLVGPLFGISLGTYHLQQKFINS